MNSLKRKWKIYVIQHSHTDIGYTQRQEKIEQYQVDFIRQAVAVCNASHSGDRPEWEGFKWTCETFWAVEKFLEQATEEEKEQFVSALRRGDIELSGSYLNMTELIDYELLGVMLAKAGKFAEPLGLQVRSALTADINGYSWGYSQALADAGIEHLLSCIHTHHGMFALGRKQYPFYWETPKGNRILVWNGEHYMVGNELGLNPDATLSYTIRDEWSVWGIAKDHWTLAEARISRYLGQLEQEEYPYDFTLVNVMGLLTDNAPPSGKVMSFIKEWNRKHGDQVEIEMTTLNRYFDLLKQRPETIPVYRGDWPDWWSDGVASTAMHTQIFRNAQRTLNVVKNLDPDRKVVKPDTIAQAEYQLMMYAEHTWGYHSSISEPWHPMVQELGVRKEAYAGNASRLVHTALDDVLKQRGDALLRPDRGFVYKVVNPHDFPVEDLAFFYLEGQWEADCFREGFEVVDEQTGTVISHQQEEVSRGYQIAVQVQLEGKEEKRFSIRNASSAKTRTTSSTRLCGSDGMYDMADLIPLGLKEPLQLTIAENYIESPFVRIAWKTGEGIVSWIDKQSGKDWIDRSQACGAFTPVYEVTRGAAGDQMNVRRTMGRNRKGIDAERSIGMLSGVKQITNGPIYGIVELKYRVQGMSHYSLFLKVYREQPRVDVSVRIHKDSVWEPENVYVSLPFNKADNGELWFEKAGANVRPGKDQILGTCTDFYCIQEGLALIAPDNGLLIATPDTPLMQIGPLEYGQRLVHGQQQENDRQSLYAWVLTNYWETNFKATLGGFYEFRYMLQWGSSIDSVKRAVQICRSLNTGTVAYRTK